MPSAPPPPRTIRELLAVTRDWLERRGVEGARLDAELLVGHALGLKRLELFLDLDRPLGEEELSRCRALVVRRGKREPVAQILGEREFYGLTFDVTPDVLVPRSDTELLVELALARTPKDATGMFIDVCTGTACVAIAILMQRPGLTAVATDVSDAALLVARRNVARHGLEERLALRSGDLLAPCADVRSARFVVGNPPYIRTDERAQLAPEVKDHEPALALFGEGSDGLGHHRRILAAAHGVFERGDAGPFVALEVGSEQGHACRAMEVEGFSACELHRDLGGHERVAVWSAQF